MESVLIFIYFLLNSISIWIWSDHVKSCEIGWKLNWIHVCRDKVEIQSLRYRTEMSWFSGSPLSVNLNRICQDKLRI